LVDESDGFRTAEFNGYTDMPNTKSAAKRAGTSAKSRLKNRAVKGGIGTARARFLKAVAGGNQSEALSLFKEFCSVVDKALKYGVIKANTASRKKSRAALRLNGLINQPT
jgi:small subunit ribosomal protein S20